MASLWARGRKSARSVSAFRPKSDVAAARGRIAAAAAGPSRSGASRAHVRQPQRAAAVGALHTRSARPARAAVARQQPSLTAGATPTLLCARTCKRTGPTWRPLRWRVARARPRPPAGWPACGSGQTAQAARRQPWRLRRHRQPRAARAAARAAPPRSRPRAPPCAPQPQKAAASQPHDGEVKGRRVGNSAGTVSCAPSLLRTRAHV